MNYIHRINILKRVIISILVLFLWTSIHMQSQVHIEWAVDIGPEGTVQTSSPSLSITGDTVYFASGTEEYLYALKSSDGSVLWKSPYDGMSLSRKLLELSSTPSKVWFCAHRGNTYDGISNIPENSVASILQCIDKQIEMVEIDVRTTKDGKFILMHDASVNRTTNGTGSVKNLTLSQIKTLRLKTKNGVLTNHQVPTLEEALISGNRRIFYNLDINGKDNNLTALVKLVESFDMLDQVVFYTGSSKENADIIKNANKQDNYLYKDLLFSSDLTRD